MSLLVYSGLLYLVGISVVLFIKPELMFHPEGNWKEFGLGRSKERHTWLPFWLFAIMWAILSYLIVLTIAGATHWGVKPEVAVSTEPLEPEQISVKSLANASRRRPKTAADMKRGYYIEDLVQSSKDGIPRYMYLGPRAPHLIFQDADFELADGSQSHAAHDTE